MVNRIYKLQRTQSQMAAFQDLCDYWKDTGLFWSWDEIVQALSRQGSLVFFSADSFDARRWYGVAMTDVGLYSADLLYIFVRPECRRLGVARALLEELLVELEGRPEVEEFFLEVRVSNTGAQRLYEDFGMERIGLRRRYYADGEDAIVYKLSLQHETRDEID